MSRSRALTIVELLQVLTTGGIQGRDTIAR